MMKIAIAGTNGLAQFIAYYLSELTSHNFVLLSRTANPGLKEKGWQVLVTSYDEQSALVYTLKGTDVVISTISGDPQLALIEAAATAQVRHFIPSAFSGPEQTQSFLSDTWSRMLALLEHHEVASSLRYTVFTCGIFYERFGPGGLNTLQISIFNNRHGAVGEEGNFLIDVKSGRTIIPVVPDAELAICMTSARDVARYVVATLQGYEDLTLWPKEFKFCTERLTMSHLLAICSRVRGTPILPSFTNSASLLHAYEAAQQAGDDNKALSISQHIAVAQAHPALNFSSTEVNLPAEILAFAQMSGTEPAPCERFETWLLQALHTPTPPASSTGQRLSATASGKTSGKTSRSGSSQKSRGSTSK